MDYYFNKETNSRMPKKVINWHANRSSECRSIKGSYNFIAANKSDRESPACRKSFTTISWDRSPVYTIIKANGASIKHVIISLQLISSGAFLFSCSKRASKYNNTKH